MRDFTRFKPFWEGAGEKPENHGLMAGQGSITRAVKRIFTALVAVVLLVGAVGYALFRIQTPVSLDQAVDEFRAGNDDTTAGTLTVGSHADQGAGHRKETKRAKKGRPVDRRAVNAAASSPASTRVRAPDGTVIAASDRQTVPFGVMPAEGVYSYRGTGEESFNSVGRNFPTEVTSRSITHLDRDTWKEHHIFSEERASWTKITAGPEGRFVSHQRNLIAIGPIYKRDTTVPIQPPLHAVRYPPRVGERWSGEFEGRTRPEGEDYTGTYTVRMVGDEIWRVGDESVRVLGYETEVEFVGELSGHVTVKYWFSPFLGMTVHEDYRIDANASGLRYKAHWNVKLTSLHPAT